MSSRHRSFRPADHQQPTPPGVFLGRREFCKSAAASLLLPACIQDLAAEGSDETARILRPPLERPGVFPAPRTMSVPLGERRTERLTAATHNNFYEFLPGRGGPVWKYVDKFAVDPWTIEVVGDCKKPGKIGLEDLFRFEHEERLYHFRCVERWAMNIPWSGFPLGKLLQRFEPSSSATHVRFISANKPEQMPGIKSSPHYPWPYFEGLRMDEAMHDLAMVVTGVYGEPLLRQHGAPIRVIVPWKYGYKSPKSIVRIEFVRNEPETFWQVQPHEYGFLSNVNPNIPHPRWSQAKSYWLGGDEDWFETPIFNGYEKQVAHLYPDEPRTPQLPLSVGQKAR